MVEPQCKETLIRMYAKAADCDYHEVRRQVDDLLVGLGAPVKYYRSLNTKPYTFHWRRVGIAEIGEFDNDDGKVEISEEEFRAAIDLHELGLD